MSATPPRDTSAGGPAMSQYSPVVSQKRSAARLQEQQSALHSGADDLAQRGPEPSIRESMAQVNQSMKGRLGASSQGNIMSSFNVGSSFDVSSAGAGSGSQQQSLQQQRTFATMDPVVEAMLKKQQAEAAFVSQFTPYLYDSTNEPPLLNGGKYIVINLLSNWGDDNYIGLGGITLFDAAGKRIELSLPSISYLTPEAPIQEGDEAGGGGGGGLARGAHPHTMSVANFFSTTDPRQRLESLLEDHVARGDETRMWLTEYAGVGAHHILCVELPVEATQAPISAIALHNYKKGRVHSLRGVRHAEILLDDTVLFRGEIRCGSMEPILLTADTNVLRNVAAHLFPSPHQHQHHQQGDQEGDQPQQDTTTSAHQGMNIQHSSDGKVQPVTLNLESQAGPSVLSSQGTFPCSGVIVDVLTTWCHPPRVLALQAMRLYDEHRQLINNFSATITVVNDEEEIEVIPVETEVFLQGDIRGEPTKSGLPRGPAILVPLYSPLPPTPAEIEAERSRQRHPDDPLPPLRLARITIEFPSGVNHRLSTVEVVNARSYEDEDAETGGTVTRYVDHYGVKDVKVSLLTRSKLNPAVVITPGAEGMTIRKGNPTGAGLHADWSHRNILACNKAQCFDISNLSDIALVSQAAGNGGDMMTQSLMMSSAVKTKVAIRRNRLSQVEPPEWQLEHHRYQTPILPISYVVTLELKFVATGNAPDEDYISSLPKPILFDEDWKPLMTQGGSSLVGTRLEEWACPRGQPFVVTSSVVFGLPTAISMILIALSMRAQAALSGSAFSPILESVAIYGDDDLLYLRERADDQEDLIQWIQGCRPDMGRGTVFFSPEVPEERIPASVPQ